MANYTDALNAFLNDKIKQVKRATLTACADRAVELIDGLTVGFKNEITPVIEYKGDGYAEVRAEDTIMIHGISRLKLMNDGTKPFSKVPDGRPMPIPIGYKRKTKTKNLVGEMGSPPTGVIFRYSRNGIEAGQWEQMIIDKIQAESSQLVSDAINGV